MKNLSALLAVCLVTSCADKVDGHSEETVLRSAEKIATGLNAADSQQFYRDVGVIATSMPAQEVPLFMDGMTQEDIAGQAQLFRLEREVESAKSRVENLEDRHKQFMSEATVRDNAPAELAKVRVSLQPIVEDGVVVNCSLHVFNGSPYNLQSLTWEVPGIGQTLTNFNPELPAGKSHTTNDCGIGSGGGETVAVPLIRAAEATPPVALWAELSGDAPDLRPWDSPDERKRKQFFYGAVEDYEAQVAEEKQKLVEAQENLAAAH